MCLFKSPNKYNRLFVKAVFMPDGKVNPTDDFTTWQIHTSMTPLKQQSALVPTPMALTK